MKSFHNCHKSPSLDSRVSIYVRFDGMQGRPNIVFAFGGKEKIQVALAAQPSGKQHQRGEGYLPCLFEPLQRTEADARKLAELTLG